MLNKENWPTKTPSATLSRFLPSLINMHGISNSSNSTLSGNAETKDFARFTSHPVRGWTGKTKLFVLLGLKMAAV